MLAARGVSLGLGKINLSDLNQLPGDRMMAAQIKKENEKKAKAKPKYIIKKKADSKTVWAACRAVIFGCIIITVGLAMTILGYFDKQFSEKTERINGKDTIYHDKLIQYQLKSMQYLGPVLMGIGSFMLIIACVVTLESRDKHAQIITEESLLQKKKRAMSKGEELLQEEVVEELPKIQRLCPPGLAPLADVDSLHELRSNQGETESEFGISSLKDDTSHQEEVLLRTERVETEIR